MKHPGAPHISTLGAEVFAALPLDFARELDWTSNVSAIQVELWVEVLVGCDGCGVVGTGTLGHITLKETLETVRGDAVY